MFSPQKDILSQKLKSEMVRYRARLPNMMRKKWFLRKRGETINFRNADNETKQA